MQPRFENSPYYAWSIPRDVGQVLQRQTFPCDSYDALLAKRQGPDSAETNPFNSIRDAINTACVCACVCVCVFIFFHREGFFRLQDFQDILEGTDQLFR